MLSRYAPVLQQSRTVGILCAIATIGALTIGLSAQLVLTPDYERLRRYEGIYADDGSGTLQVVVSPRDNILIFV